MDAWRERIIAAARAWLRTPWHHGARVRGAGVDCGQLLIAAYADAGLVPAFDPGTYSIDHMLHSADERFLGFVSAHLDPAAAPGPGDVAVWQFGQCFSHGAIVIDWPRIIHAYRPERMVVEGDGTAGALGRWHRPQGGAEPRPVRFFTLANRLGAA